MPFPENSDPNTWDAKDYAPGDWFALTIRPNEVYEILDRTDRPGGVIEFQVQRSNEPGAEPIEYTFTFPTTMPVSARRRIRTYDAKCKVCPRRHEVTTDTAYATLNAVVCREHTEETG
jgi:hypothetical protein